MQNDLVVRPHRPLNLPLVGSEYAALTRTPRRRWWNPIVAWTVAVVLGLIATMAPIILYTIGATVVLGQPQDKATDLSSVPMVFVLNLSLSLLIGVALVARGVGYPLAARFLHSVEGRVRWGWLARCVLVLMPLWIIYVVGTSAMDGSLHLRPSAAWVGMVLLTLLMTPFQSAGEEYFFRGFVMQTLGGLFRNPWIGLTLATIVSAGLFAAAHGSADPWIVTDLACMAVICVYLTWRTGGLEAALALHITNNVVVGLVGTATGTAEQSYIDSGTTGTPQSTMVSLAVMILAALLITWQARRTDIARTVPAQVGARP